MKNILFLNGKFMLAEETKLSILTPGFLLGFGLFETMRCYNKKIIYLDRHLSRLRNSAKLIGIRLPYSQAQLKGIITKTVLLNKVNDACVRLTLSGKDFGIHTLVTVKKYAPYAPDRYARGFSLQVCEFRQGNTFLAQLKATNRALYELSYRKAKAAGFNEALILNCRGNIAEASRSNIFFIQGKKIFTPALSNGCLNGVTRQVVFDLAKKNNLKIYEGRFTLLDLYRADEAFLTNSLMGVMAVASIERKRIGDTAPGKLTKFFMHKYNLLLKR